MKQKKALLRNYNNRLSYVYDKVTKQLKWKAPFEFRKIASPYVREESCVLEIGIGTGQSSKLFLEKRCNVLGVDISKKMLAIAKMKYPSIKFYQVDIEKKLPLSLQKEKFDVIVAIGVFEFLEDPDKVIRRLFKMLLSEGMLCFTYEEFLSKSKIQKWRVSELGKGIINPITKPLSFLVYRYTLADIRKILIRNNLKILKNKKFVGYLKTEWKIPVHYRIILAIRA